MPIIGKCSDTGEPPTPALSIAALSAAVASNQDD